MFAYNETDVTRTTTTTLHPNGAFPTQMPSWFDLVNPNRTAGYYFPQSVTMTADGDDDVLAAREIKSEATSRTPSDSSPDVVMTSIRTTAPSLHFPQTHIDDSGLSALSVVGNMMKDGGGGAVAMATNTTATFADFDYMHHMMQPLHLAIGRHSSQGSERHLSTDSSAPPAPTKRSRSTHDGLMKCQYCPKKAPNEAALERHMGECRVIRSHSCETCGKRFKARGGLQQHMRIHNNDKAYTCQFCAKRFTQKSHLDQHERIHTGLKPFMCSFCGRAFRQRSQQLGHESTHLSHFATSQQPLLSPSQQQLQQQPQQRSTPSSSSSSTSSISKESEVAPPLNIHPTPPTPSPEQQQLNMAAAVMMQHHQHDLSSLLVLHNHEFGGQGQFQIQQTTAEATAQGMRMLSHIAS